VNTDAWWEQRPVPKGKVVVEVQEAFLSALPPMIPQSSVLDQPILTDEDLEMLNEPMGASAEEDVEGEIDTETEPSVVEVNKDKEKDPKE